MDLARGGRGSIPRSVARLGFRNAGYRPGRSILCIALVGLATFLVVAIDAFRQPAEAFSGDRKSGNGGYPLLAESILPLYYDLNSAAGRQNLNLTALGKQAVIARFRLRPGDDVSCLNLYQPRNPRILAPVPDFLRAGRFAFASSLGRTRAIPGSSSRRTRKTAQSRPSSTPTRSNTRCTSVGGVFTAGDVKLRVVGALRDSIFQSEFLISEQNFVRVFPSQEGYRFFLIDPRRKRDAGIAVAGAVASDYGFDVIHFGSPGEFPSRGEHVPVDVSNLGIAGAYPGNGGSGGRDAAQYSGAETRAGATAGDGLPAVGLGRDGDVGEPFSAVLRTGWRLCALLAIAPAFAARGGRFSVTSLGLLLLGVLMSGLLSSLVAMRAVSRSPAGLAARGVVSPPLESAPAQQRGGPGVAHAKAHQQDHRVIADPPFSQAACFSAMGIVEETVLPQWPMATANFSSGIPIRPRRCSSMYRLA